MSRLVKTIRQHKEELAGRVTVNQLEELQKQAHAEAFQLGKDEGYQAGLEEGKEEGLQQGMEQGLKNGQEEIQHIVKRFEQIIQLLAEPLEQVDNQVENELLALSIATAKQIIRREIKVNPEQIIDVVKEALAVLPSSAKKIKVYLHPDDAEIVRDNLNISSSEHSDFEAPKSETISDTAANEAWFVVEDAELHRGGCHIKTENSQIDATIGTRIAEIAEKIFADETSFDLSELDENIVADETSEESTKTSEAEQEEIAAEDEEIIDEATAEEETEEPTKTSEAEQEEIVAEDEETIDEIAAEEESEESTPIKPTTITSASVNFVIIPSKTLLPTPLPANKPIR